MNESVEYLNKSVWATLKPSPIHGVGVFAIRDILKGTVITEHTVHNIYDAHLCFVPVGEFDQIVPEVRELILDRTMFQEGQTVLSFYSPNFEATLQSFMNHSDTPNTDGKVTLRDIKKGEELTEDFKTLLKSNPPHDLIKKHHDWLEI